MKLYLSWDQVLVGQQLQLPHPDSLPELEGDVLREGAQPADDLIHTMSMIEEMYKWSNTKVFIAFAYLADVKLPLIIVTRYSLPAGSPTAD